MDKNTQETVGRSELPIPTELQGKNLGAALKLAGTPTSEEVISAPASLQPTSGLEQLDKYTKHIHSYIREYISTADKKASFVFTIGAALLVYLYEKGIVVSWLKSPNTWNLGETLVFLAISALSISCLLAISVVFPRLQGSKRGLVFWECIADFESPSRFTETVEKLNTTELTREIILHCHELARICREKYRLLNWSLRIGSFGAISTILYLIK